MYQCDIYRPTSAFQTHPTRTSMKTSLRQQIPGAGRVS